MENHPDHNRPAHQGLKSALLYLGLPLVAFFHCLVLGESYFANDLLFGYGPIRTFLKDQLSQGHFPLWNQYLWAGQPFLADPNTQMLYPFNYISLLFPLGYGYSVFFAIHMALAGFGAHLWLKGLRLSENACRVGGTLFALSGFFWWELIHPPILAALALFPWFLAAIDRVVKEPKGSNAFLAGLSYALVFLAGNFQIALGVFYTGAAYFLYRATEKDGFSGAFKGLFGPQGVWKKLLGLGFIAFLGSLPLFLSLIPTAEMAQYSVREASLGYDKFAGTFSMRPSSLYEFLFPGLGVPADDTPEGAIQKITDSQNIDNGFLGDFGFLGVWVPFLIALSFRRKEKKLLYFLGILGALSILVALGRYFPLHRITCWILPGIKLGRAPFRFIDTYVLCACALAAMGYQYLESAIQEKKLSPNWAWAGLGYGFFLFLISLAQVGQTWREMLALGAGCSGLALWALTDSWKPLGRILFLAALTLPLLLSGWGDFGWGPASNLDYNSKFPVTSTLWQGPQAARYVLNADRVPFPVEENGQSSYMPSPANLPEVFKFRSTSGYNPLTLKKTQELASIPEKTYIELMGLQGILAPSGPSDIPHFTRKPLDNLTLYQMENPGAYLHAVTKIRVIPEGAETLQALKDPAFDPTQEALLTSALPAETAARLKPGSPKIQYQLAQEVPDAQTFRLNLDQDAVVVFSEIMYPGWKAWVDDQPAPLLTADHTFRALFLAKGDHQVDFRYQPLWAKPLWWGGVIWVIGALLYAAALFWTGKSLLYREDAKATENTKKT
jgi:hypothetical protein